MIQNNNNSIIDTTKTGRNMKMSTHQHEITVLPYAPDNDARAMNNFFAPSLESSLGSLSIEEHGMPGRERINSFDSFASSSSAFSLIPRRAGSFDSFDPSPPAFGLAPRPSIARKFQPKGVIVHPQTKGRPVVEFVLDEIPDQLMVPTL